MHVVVTGSSGMVGTELVDALRGRGDRVTRLVRSLTAERDTTHWDPEAGALEPRVFDGVDAVVHLAGESIGAKRWTAEEKRRILESRTKGTGLLSRTLAGLGSKPRRMVSASAVGIYGDRGDEVLTERSALGDGGFMASVCREWEAATRPAEEAGIAVACIRSGVILSARAGLLPRLLLPFRLGLGGRMGSGRQYVSWISLPDEVAAILNLLDAELVGPVNLTSPNPVTNAELANTLGQVLHRPTILPTPLLPVKLRYGAQLVQELMLQGQRVVPARLDPGISFRHPRLEEALRAVLDG